MSSTRVCGAAVPAGTTPFAAIIPLVTMVRNRVMRPPAATGTIWRRSGVGLLVCEPFGVEDTASVGDGQLRRLDERRAFADVASGKNRPRAVEIERVVPFRNHHRRDGV